MPETSTGRYVHDLGLEDGLQRGRLEGSCRKLCAQLLRLGKQRFGEASERDQALFQKLDGALAIESFWALADRLRTAGGWSDWLAGEAEPPAGPAEPEYVSAYEFNPEPNPPGFDMFFQVTFAPPGAKFLQRPGMVKSQRGVMHMRFQKWEEPDLDRLMYVTKCKLEKKYPGAIIQGLMFLLFPMADKADVKGKYKPTKRPGQKRPEAFTYKITKVWERAPEEYLNGGDGVLMMAPLAKMTPEQLPDVVRRMAEKIDQSTKTVEDKTMIWSTGYFYAGYVYPAELVNRAFEPAMPLLRNDKAYRETLASGFVDGRGKGQLEGQLQAARELLVRLGGKPPEVTNPNDTAGGLAVLEKLASEALGDGRGC